MALGGIAVAIGAMVDASIIMVENVHKKLERWEEGGRRGSREAAIIKGLQEVGHPIFFALLVITVSFLPIFTLEAQEGRLFSPLAYTKTFAMAAAALLSVTLVPALMVIFVRGRIVPDSLIVELAGAGLAGLEADHEDHTPQQRAQVHALADELGLLATGSSDFHGANKTVKLGAQTTAPEAYERIVAAARGVGPV